VEPVGAQEETVVGEDVDDEDVGLDGGRGADGAREDVAVRELGELLVAQAAVLELLEQGVVLGDLIDLLVADHIEAAVADVADDAHVADDLEGHGGRGHAAGRDVAPAPLVDDLGGLLEGAPDHVEERVAALTHIAHAALAQLVEGRAQATREHAHDHRRGDLARVGSADPVGDHERPAVGVRVIGVFVVPALTARVRPRCVNQFQGPPPRCRRYHEHSARTYMDERAIPG
jgi:hypothetical protein